MYFLTDHFLH